MKYTENPWFYQKPYVKSSKTFKTVAEIKGDSADEINDNGLIVSSAPELMNALLAEEAYSSMAADEGDEILLGLGYKEGSKMEFIRTLRKEALKKCGIL